MDTSRPLFDMMTWQGATPGDEGLLAELPTPLRELLEATGGFILGGGLLHVRGATESPHWHSLEIAWRGPEAFHTLYPEVRPTDIPFAEDGLGDQWLLRGGHVARLWAETGDVDVTDVSLEGFFDAVEENAVESLDVGLIAEAVEEYGPIPPGKLLLAYPPLCTEEAEDGVDLSPVDAAELYGLHAELAESVSGLADGDHIEFFAEEE